MSTTPLPGDSLCIDCKLWYPKAGGSFTKHIKTCAANLQRKRAADATERALNQRFREQEAREAETRQMTGIAGPIPKNSAAIYHDYTDDYTATYSEMDEPSPSPVSETVSTPSFIRVTPHHRSRLAEHTMAFQRPAPEPVLSPANSLPPYAPFASENDFIFAQSRIQRGASASDIDMDLKYMRNCTFAHDCTLSFKDAKEMLGLVDQAAAVYQEFTPVEYTIQLTRKDGSKIPKKYTVWVKDGMKWLRELIRDPSLANKWTWYAVKKEVVIDGVAESFVDGPMSAQDAWDQESYLEGDQVQIILLTYSDKSNATRFSKTFDIWPALARVGNLPSDVSDRNGEYAGNTLLGILPKITQPDNEKNNPHWANHVREVVHRAWDEILRPFCEPSKGGFRMKCGDGTTRTAIVRNPIIANDLEEAYKTSLTRGVQANYPCPRCLVFKTELSDLLTKSPPRTQRDSMETYLKAKELESAGQETAAEDLLKSKGLCGVKNAWWELSRADVHQAISFDILHSIFLGVWGAHMWPLLLHILGPDKCDELNRRASQVPGFPGVKHFNPDAQTRFTNIEYSDGETFFQIFQLVLPLVHDLLDGVYYPFLKCIRLLADITFHGRFQMQTYGRIDDGESLLKNFAEVLQTTMKIITDKNWEFPKLHQLTHLFDDIRQKGPLSNLSCHIGEGFHQGLIGAYQKSNKKNAAYQILCEENRTAAISRVRWRIDLEKQKTDVSAMQEEDSALGAPSGVTTTPAAAEPVGPMVDIDSDIRLFAPEGKKPITAYDIDHRHGYFAEHQHSRIFDRFGHNLSVFLQEQESQRSQEMPEPIPRTELTLQPFKRVDITYYSMDNGIEGRDIIQCRPKFHNRVRFDTVLVQTANEFRPARLHLLFQAYAYQKIWKMARVTYFTKRPPQLVDKLIGMQRYEEEETGEFIFLGSVIRACHLIPIFSTPGQFYLSNLVAGCTDQYLRCRYT